uniref:Uncharacterized protein n=1 Tax=Salarias fasciatus TaxID=181472 RepID=A0A672JBZ4_SALFA
MQRLERHSLQLCSSEPSPQSLSPSHSHLLETHFLLSQVKSLGPQVGGVMVGQFASSEPSPQSSWPSHFQLERMQCLLSQVKAVGEQVAPGREESRSSAA